MNNMSEKVVRHLKVEGLRQVDGLSWVNLSEQVKSRLQKEVKLRQFNPSTSKLNIHSLDKAAGSTCNNTLY